MSIIQQVAQAVMKKAVELAPDAWMPGGTPDPLMFDHQGLIGAPVSRLDGPLKVRGEAIKLFTAFLWFFHLREY